ncbi:hypothetical protein CEY16_05410 [Halalkalibacillus sediminis]|uniref:Uncharacterized protein n=1 Tax=Halalkalibacillus sediminis TaxID=2018042 RepID=A0A2I0QXX9_9BACI|nr:hypothetical protein [Halalkalibacillus sediminis]PKR79185.1 hypothetical protein CEY16_05410 [Halalkalibacillus sediminis]
MKYILCQPAIKRFEWELEVCITRLHQLGIRDIILLFTQQDERVPVYLEEHYDVEAHVYADERMDKSYIPSVKPYLWMKYLEEDPTREKKTYFYLDSDVLFRDVPKVKPKKDTWYASDCESYLSVHYIDSKGTDLLDRMCDVINIEPSLIRDQHPIGGAQWVIKHPTYQYWKKVYEDSNKLYQFLLSVEPEYVRKNDSNYVPIQKWTAEMWAQLWNVYHFGKQVETPKELEFCWPMDPVEKYDETNIFHNAGVMDDHQKLFFKGKYVSRTPFEDDLSHVDQNKASYEYVKAIKETKNMAKSAKSKYLSNENWRDLDDEKEYEKDKPWPRPVNKKVSQERIDELLSDQNKAGRPMIRKVEE